MGLSYPQSILYNQFLDCCERTAQKVTLSDDVVYYMLDTCSKFNHENKAFQKTADMVYLINHRLCPGQWCTRAHCEFYNSHKAYNCRKTRPKICKLYKKYIKGVAKRKTIN